MQMASFFLRQSARMASPLGRDAFIAMGFDMTTSITDAEAIARIIDPEGMQAYSEAKATGRLADNGQLWADCLYGDRRKTATSRAAAILSYLASHREAQEPVDITWQDVRLHAGEGALSAADVLNAVNAHLRSLHRYTAPPAPAGEVERLRAALEIIAGERQCLDNLMSNADVARAALNGGRE